MQSERVALSFFAEDHSSLTIDRGLIELHFARDFSEQEQCGVDMLGVRLRQFEHVGGGVETRHGVGVRPERKALPFEHLDHLAFGYVGRPVERHMFDEVSEATFVFGFPDGAESDLETHGRRAFGRRIAHDRIFHAVGQRAVSDRGIGSNVGELDAPSVGRRCSCRGSRCEHRRAPSSDG